MFVKQETILHEEDYARELQFLPDKTELPAEIDVNSADIGDQLDSEEKSQLLRVLEKHKGIFITSGNALPPPAKGALCDIEVTIQRPIAQKPRRVPPQYLQQLFELLKNLLQSGLIKFSQSEWASPIVLVLKKNKKDIRLCIDYRRVNRK